MEITPRGEVQIWGGLFPMPSQVHGGHLMGTKLRGDAADHQGRRMSTELYDM